MSKELKESPFRIKLNETIEFFQAIKDNKSIQFLEGGEWFEQGYWDESKLHDIVNGVFNFNSIRIRPEVVMVPYDEVQTEWIGKVIINKESSKCTMIIGIDIHNNVILTLLGAIDLQSAFEYYKWYYNLPTDLLNSIIGQKKE